jgi:hypothetical protein
VHGGAYLLPEIVLPSSIGIVSDRRRAAGLRNSPDAPSVHSSPVVTCTACHWLRDRAI